MTDATAPTPPASTAATGAAPQPSLGLGPLAARMAPEDLAVARAQAFGRLSVAEREDLLRHIAEQLPPAERALAGPANAHPLGLARLLQRLEGRDPGLLDRVLRGTGNSGRVGAALLGGLGVGLIGGLVGGAAAATVLTGLSGLDQADPAAEDGWLDGLFDADGLDGF